MPRSSLPGFALLERSVYQLHSFLRLLNSRDMFGEAFLARGVIYIVDSCFSVKGKQPKDYTQN